MANEDKPKQDYSAGQEALASSNTKTESDNASSEYPKLLIPGNVLAPCKNKGCTSAIDFGFVADTATWIEKFKPRELICPNPKCKLKALYSPSDLVPIPVIR
jgi:hypothetical protein